MASVLTLPTQSLRGQQSYAWLPFVVAETVSMPLACQDPTTLAALNLAGVSVFWTVANQLAPFVAVISKLATVTNAALGLCTVAIATADTVTNGVGIPSGVYAADCWAEDGSGNRLCLATGSIFLAPAYRV